MRRPRMLMHAHMHRLQHKLGRSVAALGAGTAATTQENRLAQTRELLPTPVLPNGHRQTTADQTDRQHRKRNPHGNGLALR